MSNLKHFSTQQTIPERPEPERLSTDNPGAGGLEPSTGKQVHPAPLQNSPYTDPELFIDSHMQAAIGELRAAARIAGVYYDEKHDNPVDKALLILTDNYSKFLTNVSTRNLQEAVNSSAIDK